MTVVLQDRDSNLSSVYYGKLVNFPLTLDFTDFIPILRICLMIAQSIVKENR